MTRITEQPGRHRNLEKLTVPEITARINEEDKTVAFAIENALPRLNALIEAIVQQLQRGGRLFYLGAGSGGRLAVLDAIELPTTYGIPPGKVEVILAGGIEQLALALEEKEDESETGWHMLSAKNVTENDFVLGISASGTTPFVLGALQQCRAHRIPTGCVVSNPGSPIADYADYPVEVITGPEFICGSTRMKCGTAQKMIFDMISTTAMIRLGRVEDNKMVHVKLINHKIIDRAVKMLMEKSGIRDYEKAHALLLRCGSVAEAMAQLPKESA